MDSPYAKLGRAQKHLSDLRTDVLAFRTRDPHEFTRIITQHLYDPKLVVAKFTVTVREEPPAWWGLAVGDILTNLRAALDHAVFGHAMANNTLTATQERVLNFPIVTSRDTWFGVPATAGHKAKPGARKQLEQLISQPVLDVIADNQPFHSQPPESHGLALLNASVNRDKHRTFTVVAYSNEQFEITEVGGVVERVMSESVPMIDGAVVASVVVRPDQSTNPGRWHVMPLNVEFGFIESIDLPTWGERRGVVQLMEGLVTGVEEVLDELKAVGC